MRLNGRQQDSTQFEATKECLFIGTVYGCCLLIDKCHSVLYLCTDIRHVEVVKQSSMIQAYNEVFFLHNVGN